MNKIIKAIPLDNHRMEIHTTKGISGIFDVKPAWGVVPSKSLRMSPISAWSALPIMVLHGRTSRISARIPLSGISKMLKQALQRTQLHRSAGKTQGQNRFDTCFRFQASSLGGCGLAGSGAWETEVLHAASL